MMKKRIFLLLLIFCLGLGGCGKKEEQTKKKTTATEEVGIASKDAMLTLSMRIPETLGPNIISAGHQKRLIASSSCCFCRYLILTKVARHALLWRRIGNFRRMAEAFP